MDIGTPLRRLMIAWANNVRSPLFASSLSQSLAKAFLKMKTIFAFVVALVAGSSAFNVAVPAARLAATRQSSSSLSAYVPDGLTEQQWENMKKKKAEAASAKKKKVASKNFESLDTFMKGMESGKRGHTFAKVDETLTKLLPAGARGVKQD